MDSRKFQIQAISDPNSSSTDVYHLALDIGGMFHFFFAFFNFNVDSIEP